MATEHHSWFKSALPEQHKALSEFIKSQAVNGDDFTVSMSEIAASAVFSSLGRYRRSYCSCFLGAWCAQ